MISYLFLALIFGIGVAIYWGIWNATREKLDNENEKIIFLESKFIHLKNTKEGKKTITGISVSLPHSKMKAWEVYKTVKSGVWPFDEEKEVLIFSILDTELEQLEEYTNDYNSSILKSN